MQTIVNFIGWVGVILIIATTLFFAISFLVFLAESKGKLRRVRKYSYNEMFDAYKAGIEYADSGDELLNISPRSGFIKWIKTKN